MVTLNKEKIIPCDFSKYNLSDTGFFTPLPIDVVRLCLTSFPYDPKNGKEIIYSIAKTLAGYYVFLDSARGKPNPGNTYDAIDVVNSLEALLKREFKTDYDFTLNVTDILDQLKDAHTQFRPFCYKNFVFLQGIDLYSVVDSNGQQSIKVLDDFFDHTNKDCNILQINGAPALQAIKQYADKNIGLVRDLGVRFNLALTSLSFKGSKEFSNYFSRRQYLPPTNEISYTLLCNGKKKNVIRAWTACGYNNAISSVKNSKAYWNQNCLPSSDTQLQYRDLKSGFTTQGRLTTEDNICGTINPSIIESIDET
ncbi:7785_t:CDS:2, partial [Acaulospora colombiana]